MLLEIEGYDLTDATEARAYLMHAAVRKANYADALAQVLRARPTQLQALWGWAMDQHGSLINGLDLAYIRTIYFETEQGRALGGRRS